MVGPGKGSEGLTPKTQVKLDLAPLFQSLNPPIALARSNSHFSHPAIGGVGSTLCGAAVIEPEAPGLCSCNLVTTPCTH